MSVSKIQAVATTCVAALASFTAPALAAEASDKNDSVASALTEIIVTARRVEENMQQVPVAVTALSAKMLESRNVNAVSDIQFNVPNLQIKPSNLYPAQPEFIIRGQRQQLYTDENVVTYVNGVPQGTRGLTLYDMESVQALKGPQGTLFGKSSLGGAMVFTTNRPTYDLGGSVELDYGNYDRKTATAVLNLPLVADKAALRLAGNIERRHGVYENSFPGAEDLDNLHNESGRATLLLVPTDRLETITTVDYLHRDEVPPPSEIEAAPLAAPGFAGLAALLTRQGVTQQSALGGGTPVASNGLLYRRGNPFRFSSRTGIGPTSPSTLGPLAVNPLDSVGSYLKTYGAANTTTITLTENVRLRNIFGYRDEQSKDFQDPSAIGGFAINVAPFLTVLGVPGLPSVFPGTVVNNNTNYINERKTYTEELQLIAELPNLKLIGGAFYSHQKEDSTVLSYFSVGAVSLYQPFPTHHREGHVTTKSKALFAQGTYDFSGIGAEGLRATLGARYNWDEKGLENHDFYSKSNNFHEVYPAANTACAEVNRAGAASTGVNTPTECSLTGEHSWHAITWTASLEYQLAENTLVYLANRRGYKTGGVTPTSSVNPDYNFFNPEELTDYELGLKHQAYLGAVPYRLNVAGFYGKYRDIQTQDILPFCVNAACPGGLQAPQYTDLLIFNVGKATIKGVEVEASVKPVPELTLDLGYSYQVGRYGSGSVIPQPAHAGPIGNANPIDFASGTNLSDHEFPGIPRQTLSAAGSLEIPFVPKSFANTVLNMNYAYRTSTRGLTSAGVFGTPAFGILGGRLAFEDMFGSTFSLAMWGQNLTDKDYRLACSDNLNSIGYATCKWGEPRTYGVTGTYKF